MIRPFTFVCMVLAAGSGLYLYSAKHQAQLLDRKIARVVKAAEGARERTAVLRAEYTLLNDPQRLSELSAVHLATLRSTVPGQFTTPAEFEKRLPPVGAPAVEAAPLEPEAPQAKLPEPKPEPKPELKPEPKPEPKVEARPVAMARPPVPVPGPTPVMATAPAPRPPVRAAAVPAALAPTPLAPTPIAPAPRPTPAVYTQPAPAYQAPAYQQAPTYQAPAAASQAAARAGTSSLGTRTAATQAPAPTPVARYVPPPGSPAEAVANIARGAPVDTRVPAVASALGMARSMVPSSPVGSANAAPYWPNRDPQQAGAR
jgi:hypothetical protein